MNRIVGRAAFSSAPSPAITADTSSSSSSSAATANNNTHKNSVNDLKDRLLRESLKQVPTHGWTSDAIAAAAAACCCEEGGNRASSSSTSSSMAVAGLITVPDLMAYTMEQWNEQLRQDLRKQQTKGAWEQSSSSDASTTSTSSSTTSNSTDKIVWALQRRLSYEQDLIRAGRWHEGMAVGAHPDSLMQTQGQLASLIDIVLLETCGPSEQFSIVERLSLGAVYVAVELHMLSDKSVDYTDTWAFLEQRVRDWEMLRKSTGSVMPALPNVSHLMQSHSPSDLAFTASAVGSALASGAMSILFSNSNNPTTTASATNASGSSSMYTGQGDDFGVVDDGSHPSHYDSPPSSSAATNSKSE